MSLLTLAAPSAALAVTAVEASMKSEPKVVVVEGEFGNELQMLAEREAANPELGDFIGGNPVIIVLGSGTLLIILVVVLVVLILR